MSVNIENEYGDIDIKNYEDVITSIVQASLEFVGCPYPCEVNVLLTDNDSIHEINNQQRNIDRATDVLSFPLIDYTIPGNFDGLEDSRCDYFDLTTDELLLGDIVISIDKVYEQATEYNHSKTRELAFLVAHKLALRLDKVILLARILSTCYIYPTALVQDKCSCPVLLRSCRLLLHSSII